MAPLSTPVRRRLARDLAAHSADRPTLGDVELSVLTRTAAATFLHPSPFELHYSAD